MIYLASDHRGYEMKEKIKAWLAEQGRAFEDCGPDHFDQDDDYPDFAERVGRKVAESPEHRGIVLCGSGIGIAVAANKIAGVRAGTAISAKQITAAVNDENLNVLALAADYTPEEEIKRVVEAFLDAKFSGEERHMRRINKIKALER